MYDPRLYASGVYGVLLVTWRMVCETPLAVRNGIKIVYQERELSKTRGINTTFSWQQRQGTSDREVTALYYGYEIKNGRVNAYHFIPPSSVRGTLRSWTINHLVQPNYRKEITPPAKEKGDQATQEYLQNIRGALASPDSGYQWIASLFGQAFDTRGKGDELSNAGRLRVETERFLHNSAQSVAVNGKPNRVNFDPSNAMRQMTVRNPLDRVTHSSKEGGLHHFLEFCKGETFTVRLRVINPRPGDLGLISLWRREINDGMLRFGALSSIGRGRVRIDDAVETSGQAPYLLWINPRAPASAGMKEHLLPAASASDGEALAGLWDAYTLPADQLNGFEKYLTTA